MLLTKLAKKICQSKEYINGISLYKKKNGRRHYCSLRNQS